MTLNDTYTITVTDGGEERELSKGAPTTVGQVREELGVEGGWCAFLNGTQVSASKVLNGDCELEFFPKHKDKGTA